MMSHDFMVPLLSKCSRFCYSLRSLKCRDIVILRKPVNYDGNNTPRLYVSGDKLKGFNKQIATVNKWISKSTVIMNQT